MIMWCIKTENKHCMDVKPFHLIKLQAAVRFEVMHHKFHIWG